MSTRILRFLLLIAGLLSIVSCEDPFEKTTKGRNTLAFILNNKKIYCDTYYIINFRVGYYFDDKDNLISIQAYLDSEDFPFLSIKIPSDYIETGSTLKPKVKLEYLYLPSIYNHTYDSSGKTISLKLVREAEYRSVDVSASSLHVRMWDKDSGVLAGDFSFKGEYADSLGKIHTVNVTDGVFDIKHQWPTDQEL